ncbi:MAG: hypothetical protein IPM20_11710 [Gammaproteobacteria bacterium]|nr:hypothetical protein [Gammaproteobacteria bacterium]
MGYLARAFPALSVYTFRVLDIGGDIGLLIDPVASGPRADEHAPATGTAPFRCGLDMEQQLSAEEERHFADA